MRAIGPGPIIHHHFHFLTFSFKYFFSIVCNTLCHLKFKAVRFKNQWINFTWFARLSHYARCFIVKFTGSHVSWIDDLGKNHLKQNGEWVEWVRVISWIEASIDIWQIIDCDTLMNSTLGLLGFADGEGYHYSSWLLFRFEMMNSSPLAAFFTS